MKKIIAPLLLSLLSLALFILPIHSPTTTKLYVSPPFYATGQVGKSFAIDVTVAGVANLYGFDFKLSFNTTLLDAKSIAIGPFFPSLKSYVLKTYINETDGYVWFAVVLQSPEPAKTGSGILATVTFNATLGTIYNATSGPIDDQTLDCSLQLYDTVLVDQAARSIAHDPIGGFYEFVPIIGDIDGNGIVNTADFVIVALAFGSIPGDSNWNILADLDGSGTVDIFDAVIVGNNFGIAG